MAELNHYLILSGVLFTIGTAGVLLRRNVITVFLSVEIMLNAVNLTRRTGHWGTFAVANSPLMRGVAAGESAQRGTSGAANGGGGRAALPRPGCVMN